MVESSASAMAGLAVVAGVWFRRCVSSRRLVRVVALASHAPPAATPAADQHAKPARPLAAVGQTRINRGSMPSLARPAQAGDVGTRRAAMAAVAADARATMRQRVGRRGVYRRWLVARTRVPCRHAGGTTAAAPSRVESGGGDAKLRTCGRRAGGRQRQAGGRAGGSGSRACVLLESSREAAS